MRYRFWGLVERIDIPHVTGVRFYVFVLGRQERVVPAIFGTRPSVHGTSWSTMVP